MIGLDRLPHMQRGEEVLLLLRRDLSVIFLIIVRFVVMGLAPLLARWYVITFFPDLLVDSATRPLLILLMFIFYLFLWLFFYRAFIDYYLDVWIVTNHRILNIELEGLFNRIVSEQKLFRIQDVTTEQRGFLAHFLDYGDVFIQTAGTKERFVFEQVSSANSVAHQIVQLVAWHKKAFPDEHD